MAYIVARPAYGLRVSCAEEIKQHWLAGTDFECTDFTGRVWVGGRYFSIRDVERLKQASITAIYFTDISHKHKWDVHLL